MKIKLWCNNGANIHSCRKEVIDLIEDWGYSQEDCDTLTDDEIQRIAKEWADEFLDIGGYVIEGDE